jgi:hypothetical protein
MFYYSFLKEHKIMMHITVNVILDLMKYAVYLKYEPQTYQCLANGITHQPNFPMNLIRIIGHL